MSLKTRTYDRGLKALQRGIKRMQDADAKVKVGVLGKSGSKMVVTAATNEFGTTKAGARHNVTIPARPFLRPVGTNKELAAFVAGQLKAILRVPNPEDPRRALGKIGEKAVALVRQNIASHPPPPNAPSTIEKKGSSGTLVDTGRLRQSIAWAFAQKEGGHG